MAPSVHSPKGFWLALLLLRLLEPFGLAWLAWALVPFACWVAHWLADIIIHFEFIHTGSRKQFKKALKKDPKNKIKAIGLWPILNSNGRCALACIDPSLASPRPLDIFARAMIFGILDVLAAGLLALWLAWHYANTPVTALIGLWGAAWAVAPDILLFRPIYERLIGQNWFWRLDYFHHWIHTRVLAYEWRWWGLAIQISAMLIFIYLALHA